MAAESAKRMQDTFEREIDSIEKKLFRPIQHRAYTCMAKCTANSTDSAETVTNCMNACARDMKRFDAITQHEVEQFQSKLSRCSVRCQDRAQSGLNQNSSDADIQKAQKLFDQCQAECAAEFEKLARQLGSNIKAAANA